MLHNPLVKVEREDDPRRCNARNRSGQCEYVSLPDMNYCGRHGSGVLGSRKSRELKRYQLAVWQERVEEMANDPNIKSLDDELAILRMTLEQIVAGCRTGIDIVVQSPRIADLVAKIEKLVTTCAKLEHEIGDSLSKKALISIATQIVNIVAVNVEDEQVVLKIANEVEQALAEAKNVKEPD